MVHGTDSNTYKGRQKAAPKGMICRNVSLRKGFAAFLLAFGLFIGISSPAVHAEAGLSSRGSLVYQEGKKQAAVFAEDFLTLHKKLSTISQEAYDPLCYTHTHQWEYRNVNEKTHTRHCGLCGSAFDLESVHSASHVEDDVIRHEGASYPGRRYRCVCGWQWEQEAAHVTVFEAVDAINHRSRCLLEDTAFCRGYEPSTEEHYAYSCDPCEDGTHHIKSCIDCGYQTGIEECDFSLRGIPEDGENNDPVHLYCICGNRKADGDGEDQPETESAGSNGEGAEAKEPEKAEDTRQKDADESGQAGEEPEPNESQEDSDAPGQTGEEPEPDEPQEDSDTPGQTGGETERNGPQEDSDAPGQTGEKAEADTPQGDSDVSGRSGEEQRKADQPNGMRQNKTGR